MILLNAMVIFFCFIAITIIITACVITVKSLYPKASPLYRVTSLCKFHSRVNSLSWKECTSNFSSRRNASVFCVQSLCNTSTQSILEKVADYSIADLIISSRLVHVQGNSIHLEQRLVNTNPDSLCWHIWIPLLGSEYISTDLTYTITTDRFQKLNVDFLI